MAEEKKSIPRRTGELRLLLGSLGGLCLGCRVSPAAVCGVVAVGLFPHGPGYCLAQRISVGDFVLAYGQGREMRRGKEVFRPPAFRSSIAFGIRFPILGAPQPPKRISSG